MKLNKADSQTFMIRLTSLIANDDGSYNQVTALLKSSQELIISQIPIGTYLLEELNDNYFDFVGFEENNGEDIIINGVTFERTDQGYVLTISEDLTENVEFNRMGEILVASVPTIPATDQVHYDVILLVALFGLTIWLSQKIMMATTQNKNQDPQQAAIQKSMGRIMPIMIIVTFVFIPIPAGALLYLVTSNIFQIFQTLIINKQLEMEELAKNNAQNNIIDAKVIDAKVVNKEEK
jgi:membrane protein insertase Oxa1/YidC/SpoIIIJ